MRWWWCPLFFRPTCLVFFFIVLTNWNNSPRIYMSLHSDTCPDSEPTSLCSFSLILRALHYKQQIPVDNLCFEIWICLYTCTQKVAFYVSSAEGLWKREKLTVRCNVFCIVTLSIVIHVDNRGGSRGRGGAGSPKIGKNMIFWRKIVIFHTKYPNIFLASRRSAQFFWVRPP
jgi:hypothetical protein